MHNKYTATTTTTTTNANNNVDNKDNHNNYNNTNNHNNTMHGNGTLWSWSPGKAQPARRATATSAVTWIAMPLRREKRKNNKQAQPVHRAVQLAARAPLLRRTVTPQGHSEATQRPTLNPKPYTLNPLLRRTVTPQGHSEATQHSGLRAHKLVTSPWFPFAGTHLFSAASDHWHLALSKR